jgi:hypothetical protein
MPWSKRPSGLRPDRHARGAVPWQAPGGQETDDRCERIVCCVPPSRAGRSHPLALWADVIALGWCSEPVAAPYPYRGSIAAHATTAAIATPGFCDLETYLFPHTVLCKDQAQRVALASERQARVRGSPRQPLTTIAAFDRSESGCPINAQGSGDRDRYAPGRSRTPWIQPCRARLAGASPGCPVRRQAHPLPSMRVGRTDPYRTPRGV